MRSASTLAVLGALAAGCAAGAEAQAPPAGPADTKAAERAPLGELDALEHDLAVAEERLDEQLGRRRAAVENATTGVSLGGAGMDRTSASAPPAAAPPADAPPRPRAESRAEDRAAGDATATPAASAACDVACRALASMRRSAERIAELAGPQDARTVRARERVAAAAERVQRAGCACRAPDRP
jgi:hypothetical protein